jgi:hypothetical protein
VHPFLNKKKASVTTKLIRNKNSYNSLTINWLQAVFYRIIVIARLIAQFPFKISTKNSDICGETDCIILNTRPTKSVG